jgi:hypothetical protein
VDWQPARRRQRCLETENVSMRERSLSKDSFYFFISTSPAIVY